MRCFTCWDVQAGFEHKRVFVNFISLQDWYRNLAFESWPVVVSLAFLPLVLLVDHLVVDFEDEAVERLRNATACLR